MEPRSRQTLAAALFVIAAASIVSGCDSGGPTLTPTPTAGTVDRPREVNIIAREYAFSPPVVDLIPGETVLLHVINAGLDVHEAVIGDAATQDAWEAAEAAVEGAPPGPTPVVTVPPGVSGLRIVVQSGQRVDVRWTVPAGGPALIVGCHIPGHWAKGMQVPVRLVGP
ncbi:MAG: hypothetical protein IVW53_05625 [Chloroflexi bacterium]|nr:hypothetical protein [Chloroflexota bacterium]